MDQGVARHRVGDIEVLALYDGSFEIPTENLVANASERALEELIARGELPEGGYELPLSPLLVRTAGSNLLVDAGYGSGAETSGRLVAWLDKAGLQPAEIDLVLLSHAHADHVGGLTDRQGAPVFPHAEVAIAQAEWDHWQPDADAQDDNPFQRLTRRTLAGFRNRVRFLGAEEQVSPGVEARVVAGHTPGHLLIEIRSGSERLILLNDLLLHPLHLAHPEWYALADHDGPKNVKARRRVLAASEGMLCHAYHFAYPGLGRVQREGESWAWEPLGGFSKQHSAASC